MAAIVELVHLTRRYARDILAVDDLSLDIREGEFVTLLGPSGCGKTTTLRMIAGFETPTAGRIRLAGEDVTDLPPYRRQVNTVFQDYALFPHMSIRDNVGYGLRVSGVPRVDLTRRVGEALEMIGLPDKGDARPHELSGGQKQRVALARALVRRPKVLLLDEPLSALDAKLRAAMQVELKHLHEQVGITFLFVTHDQTEALVMSDRIVVMHQGRIAQTGTPTELYDHPASPYVANFIGVSNLFAGRVVRVEPDGIAVADGGREIRCRPNGRRFQPGDRAVLAVRPEKAMVLVAGTTVPDGFSAVPGLVRDCLFHGDSFRLEVDIGQPQPFLVDVPLQTHASRAVLPVPGAPVTVVVNGDAVTAFRADEAP